MTVAIQNFRQADYPNKVVMLGAMKELGEDSKKEHQDLIHLLEESNWNHVVLVGGDFASCQHDYHYFDDAETAKKWFREQNFKQTAILIKGSRAIAMEKILS